jgi:hypothetical protein
MDVLEWGFYITVSVFSNETGHYLFVCSQKYTNISVFETAVFQ